jgi:hypothetical protein
MSQELSVINMHDKDTPKHPLPHAFLPDPQKCFRMIIFSPSNSGKSNLIKNLITCNEFGYSKYDKQIIFLFSPTIHDDPIWKDLKQPKTHLYDSWNEQIVENIMAYALQHGGAPNPGQYDNIRHCSERQTRQSAQETVLSRPPSQSINHTCQSETKNPLFSLEF